MTQEWKDLHMASIKNKSICFGDTEYNEPANINVEDETSYVERSLSSTENNPFNIVMKIEPADDYESLTEANTGEGDSADVVEDVRLPDAATVKEELDIGLTVLQPSDLHLMPRPCKLEPADITLEGNSTNARHHRSTHSSANNRHGVRSTRSLRKKTRNKVAAPGAKHTCERCNKAFPTASKLDAHRVTHTGDRPHRCDVCKKQFKLRHHLDDHSMTHSVEPVISYICDLCGTCTRKKSNLIRHIRIHLGEPRRPCGERYFSCIACNKRFTQKIGLDRHASVHSGKRLYRCDMCSKKFTQKSSLVRHALIHSGERPHSCDVCSKSFTRKFTLMQHKEAHSSSAQL